MHMYTYLDWLPVDRLPVDWLPMEPPMDVDRLPVGMVAFGSLACRPGCLWLGSMYTCNTIFHIYTYMHMYIHIYVHVYIYIHIYIHVYLCIYIEVYAYMYTCTDVHVGSIKCFGILLISMESSDPFC